MFQTNAVFTGVRRGLLRPGAAQLAYLNCLMLQAIALFIWWSNGSLAVALAKGQGPKPLLATVVALGLSVAYYSIRAGAEEFLLTGQQSLREWVVGTHLSIRRIVSGSLLGHLLQTLHLLVLSSPLLCLAYSVGGGEWNTLAWSLSTVVFQATFYWLVGAVVYMAMGQHGQTTFVTVRAIVVAGYLAPVMLAPATSHLVVSAELLGNEATVRTSPGHLEFLLVYAGLIAILVITLYALLWRYRRRSEIRKRPTRPGHAKG